MAGDRAGRGLHDGQSQNGPHRAARLWQPATDERHGTATGRYGPSCSRMELVRPRRFEAPASDRRVRTRRDGDAGVRANAGGKPWLAAISADPPCLGRRRGGTRQGLGIFAPSASTLPAIVAGDFNFSGQSSGHSIRAVFDRFPSEHRLRSGLPRLLRGRARRRGAHTRYSARPNPCPGTATHDREWNLDLLGTESAFSGESHAKNASPMVELAGPPFESQRVVWLRYSLPWFCQETATERRGRLTP